MNETEIRPEKRHDLGPFEALARVARMFYAPRRTTAEIREHPNWVFPLLLSIFFSFLAAAVLFSRPEWQDVLLKSLIETDPDLSEMDKVRALDSMRAAAWTGALAAPVIGNLILSVLLWAVVTFREGKTTFLRIFSFQLHAQMVTVVPQVLAVAWVLMQSGSSRLVRGEGTLPSTLAFYLPPDIAPGLRAAAGAIDLFSLWYWVLVMVGLAVLVRKPTRQFLVPVAALWGAGMVFRATFLSLGGGPA